MTCLARNAPWCAGMIIYKNLGSDEETSFAQTWGIGYARACPAVAVALVTHISHLSALMRH